MNSMNVAQAIAIVEKSASAGLSAAWEESPTRRQQRSRLQERLREALALVAWFSERGRNERARLHVKLTEKILDEIEKEFPES